MKIWITRQSAGPLLFSGLECLDVWFEKPTYHQIRRWQPDEFPFQSPTPEGFYEGDYWSVTTRGSVERGSISLGRVFGFGKKPEPSLNEITKLAWEKLCEHFGNEPYGESWIRREIEGLSKKYDFILEIELSINMISAL